MDEPGKLRKRYSDSTVTVELKNNEKVVLKTTDEDAQQMFDYMSSNNVVAIHSNEPTLGDIFVEVTGRKLS